MTDSMTFTLEQGESLMDAMQRKLDELEIDADIELIETVQQYNDLIKNRLLN